MRLSTSLPVQRLLAWDRHPGRALALRLAVTLLALRPWAWSFQPVDYSPAALDPVILEAARAAGIDVLTPRGWPTAAGVVASVLLAGCGFAVLWWALSRARRALMARVGFGALTFLAVTVGWLGLQFAGIPLLMRAVPATPFMSSTIGVWGGWLGHPLVAHGGFQALFTVLALQGVLLGEPLLMAAEGQTLLEEARDGALRARLSPHFLFNTLTTLEAQIETDPPGALDTTRRLGALFGQVLQVTRRATLPLREELAMVEDYLALERRRLGERLRVSVEIPEELLDREVPVLSLQVLVENALKHAVAPRIEGGSVRIHARAEGRGLRVAVEDSGDGATRGRPGAGQALDNLRRRLRRPGHLRLCRTAAGFEASFLWS